MNEVTKLLTVAAAEVGYHEKGDNYTKYGQEIDQTDFFNGPKNGYAWCCTFVAWCFWKAFGHDRAMELMCIPSYSCAAGCSFSANYYKAAARWSTTPKIGAQVYFRGYAHTGIVESVTSGYITTIEGNTSDCVARRTYRIGDSQIDGYGIPDFADEYVEQIETTPPMADIVIEPADDTPPDPGIRYLGIVRKGMVGSDVKVLQALLDLWGYSCGTVDGDFGRNTLKALVSFQSDHNLEPDGEAGPLTFGVLLNIDYGGSD